MPQYYEDLEVGAGWPPERAYLVTEDEIVEMGRRWDPQPFHTDPEAAAGSVFGGLVASTVHLFAISVCLGVTSSGRTAAISSLGMNNVVNHAPVRPGDEVRKFTEVIDRRLSQSRPGVGIVTFRNTLHNQRDEPVFSWENTALIHCRESPED